MSIIPADDKRHLADGDGQDLTEKTAGVVSIQPADRERDAVFGDIHEGGANYRDVSEVIPDGMS